MDPIERMITNNSSQTGGIDWDAKNINTDNKGSSCTQGVGQLLSNLTTSKMASLQMKGCILYPNMNGADISLSYKRKNSSSLA